MPSASSNDLVWIRLHVEMSSAYGSDAEDYVSIPRAEWDAMTEAERDQWIDDILQAHLSNTVSAGGWVVADDDVPDEYRNR